MPMIFNIRKSHIVNFKEGVTAKGETEHNLKAEQEAIRDYEEMLTAIDDPKVREVIEEILADERDHEHNLDCVRRYLAGEAGALEQVTKAIDPELQKAVKASAPKKPAAKAPAKSKTSTKTSKTSKASDLAKKYPGGKWVTMHGRHIYIMKDGKPAPETPIPDSAKKTTTKTAPKAVDKTKDKTPAKEPVTVKKEDWAKGSKVPAPPKLTVSKDAVPKTTKKTAPKVKDIRSEAQANRKVAYDVGDKIGRAKKDMQYWRDRFALTPTPSTLEEIEKADPAWANAVVTKENCLPKSGTDDWLKQEQEQGTDFRAAWMKQYIYSKVAKKPDETPQARMAYVVGCQHLQDILGQLRKPEDVIKAMTDMTLWMRHDDPAARIPRLKELIKNTQAKLKLSDDDLVAQSSYRVSETWTKERLAPYIRNNLTKLIADRKEEMKVMEKTPENAFYRFRALGEDYTKLFTKSAQWDNFRNALDKKPKDWDAHWGKKEAAKTAEKKEAAVKVKWGRKMPEKITREGGKQVRISKPEELVKDFGFRGVEFGNWVDDHSGKFHLQKAAEALTDLAEIIGVNHKQVSFNGRLGLAFGARGRGGALAHYEPDLTVINLTKESGTGSLGHEWMHALDHAVCSFGVGRQTAKYASEGSLGPMAPAEVRDAYKALMKEMHTGRGLIPMQMTEEEMHKLGYSASYSMKQKYEEMGGDIDKVMSYYRDQKERQLQSAIQMQEYYGGRSEETKDAEIAKTKKKLTKEMMDVGRALVKLHYEKTGKFSGGAMVPGFSSQFKQNSLSYEKGGKAYWSTPVEMFARAGESWMQDKLREKGRQNDYLVYDVKGEALGSPYPHGEERVRINKAYDRLFEALHSTGTIQKALEMDFQKATAMDVMCGMPTLATVNPDVLPDDELHPSAFEQYRRNAYPIPHDCTDEIFYIPTNRLSTPYQNERATDMEKVEELKERINRGEALPPIVIGYAYDVHDGHHRLIASTLMGRTHIPCVVGGNNDLEVQRAKEDYGATWKSFAVWCQTKDDINLLKSMGGVFDEAHGMWVVTVDFTSEALRTLADMTKRGADLKEV